MKTIGVNLSLLDYILIPFLEQTPNYKFERVGFILRTAPLTYHITFTYARPEMDSFIIDPTNKHQLEFSIFPSVTENR